jgi:hypothetical protein
MQILQITHADGSCTGTSTMLYRFFRFGLAILIQDISVSANNQTLYSIHGCNYLYSMRMDIKGADVPQDSKRCTEVYDPSVRCAYTDDDDILVRCAYTDDDDPSVRCAYTDDDDILVRCAYTDDDDILVRCAYTDDDGTNHATALQAWHVSDANSDDATIPTCVNNCPRNIGS